MIKNIFKKIKNKNFGFTLVETLIYIAIMSIVLVSFITFILSISNSRNKAFVVQEVQANARIAMNIISQKIKTANDVNIGDSVFGADPGVLSLAMQDANKNPTIINLSQDNGILQIKEGTNDPIQVTSSDVQITNLVFSDFTNGTSKENIKIEISVDYKNQEDAAYAYSQSLITAVSLRQ
jgi:type II secretory pathway pseudopilin PulG